VFDRDVFEIAANRTETRRSAAGGRLGHFVALQEEMAPMQPSSLATTQSLT
jgi:hypothetical protein